MKTVTIPEAKNHLGAYLRAVAGTNLGIICGNRIVALRPVEVTSIDFEDAGDPDLAAAHRQQRPPLLNSNARKPSGGARNCWAACRRHP